MAQQITLLPTPVPTVADPVNFDARADAFLAALPTFATEANLLAIEVNNEANLIIGYFATDSAAITIGTGSKSLTIDQINKAFFVNQPVLIYQTIAPTTNYMSGTITAFTPSTGAMTVNVTSSAGSGSHSGWTIVSTAPILAPVSIGSILYTQAYYGVF